MVLCNSSVIENTCKFLNASNVGNLSSSAEQTTLKSKDGSVLKGFATILESIIRSQRPNEFTPCGAEEMAQLRQWLEFCICVVNYADKQAASLKELNDHLSTVNYLVGNQISVADAILYFIVHPILTKSTMHEKEQLCHISRWFSTVQQHPKIRSSDEYKLISFSRNILYGNVSKH
ncbi:eukaryotic translation elongation factor 1 epsilon-1 [Neocloeon triangulifer]|uniref:eukaryotic translation elongation factor 1 epsilon-1 n=1 Tax=Neocloeon triangulifer TaxID=2078957 RepID=UPI00286F9112|nr:eukaryotic translation elongation factor 1 epsilon-1 [Neocloeon triangulifer]